MTLVYWDEEIQVEEENYSRFKAEDEIQRYLDYVQFIVHHFKDRIEYYEILEYPESKIVAGAITPLYCIEETIRIEPGAREYLFGILESGIMPLVDAVSWHAMGGASPGYGEDYYYEYSSIVENIKDVASAHGFEGEYIAEELHWRTPRNPVTHGYSEYSEIAAAKYYARGIMMNLGIDVTVGLAETSHELDLPKMTVIRNLCTLMAGAKPISLPIEIQSKAEDIRSYSFSLTNGDILVALWTDGIAVDEDPGVEAKITLQGFSAQDVIGIDVLEGYQQPIVTSNENGNMLIQNLLVRDYPLILHITKSSIQK